MERKTLTLKRQTTDNVAENTEPVIQRRRKQVVVNMQRKRNKSTQKTHIQSPKKVAPHPAKKKDTVVIPLEKKVIAPSLCSGNLLTELLIYGHPTRESL